MPVLSLRSASSVAGNMSAPGSTMDIVHLAVVNTIPSASSNHQNHMVKYSRQGSLQNIVNECAQVFKLSGNPEDYALQFEKSDYVSEKTKAKIHDGIILKLVQSPKKLVNECLRKLRSPSSQDANNILLQSIEHIVSDHAVAAEFVNAHGMDLIMDAIRKKQTTQSLVLIFNEIMGHDDLFSWEDKRIDAPFVEHVAENIETERTKRGFSLDDTALTCTLGILETLVRTASKYEITQQAISVPSLLNFLQKDSQVVQWHALALFNSMFKQADKDRKRKLQQLLEERNIRNIIKENVIRKGKINEDLRHQLYVLQAHLLNLLHDTTMTKVESNDTKALEKIKELRKIAFDVQAGPQQRSSQEYWKKLGFRDHINPIMDFQETPPGMLALELMYRFASSHPENYTRFAVFAGWSDNHEFPFARTSIELVKIICEIVRIGHDPAATEQASSSSSSSSSSAQFYPMFFAHENPLDEMFAVVIMHVNKTWREMRATTADFDKVMEVAKEQITQALQEVPPTMQEFQKGLKSYSDINRGRKEVAEKFGERDGKAIQQLRAIVSPEILDLIRQQRLNHLERGSRLSYAKGKGKFFFCKLSPNHKSFHYGEWNDEAGSSSPIETLQDKVQVAEIKGVKTGPKCPHVVKAKVASRERNPKWAFSLIGDNGDSLLDFYAPDEKTFDYWWDGISALLREEMQSAEFEKDRKMLLDMEIRIRLLDVEGMDIPEEPPEIPPLPTNFDFWQEA